MSDRVKSGGATCVVCRGRVRKGSWAVLYGGFERHPACMPVGPVATVPCDDEDCACGGPLEGSLASEEYNASVADVAAPALGPREQLGEKGPWFGAMYDGLCSVNECVIAEGDRIRADGEGGYECEDCGDFPAAGEEPITHSPADWQKQASAAAKRHLQTAVHAQPGEEAWTIAEQASAAAKRHVAARVEDTPYAAFVALLKTELSADMANSHGSAGGADLADPFEDPTPAAVRGPEKNVSGQPKPEYEWRGQQNLGYLVKLPWTGDYQRYGNGNAKGITRATTFNKELSRGLGLSDWRARNVLIGATRRPDVVDRAHGLTHEDHKRELMKLVAELETAAGAKVSADIGTYLHGFTEEIDAGLKTPADAPERYRAQLELYVSTLADAGFEAVPGLIERTTMIREFGGVVGTFDRIVYHSPSDTYMIADLKTGKTADYLVEETETQEWIYAHGVNQHGVYDWNTNTWQPPRSYGDSIETGPWEVPEVSETQGVIIWMPVQGEHAGTVQLLDADLEAGARHAERCHDARTRPKRKPVPWVPPVAPLWRDRFAAVKAPEQAGKLWEEARAAGVAPMELQELVRLARDTLARRGY